MKRLIQLVGLLGMGLWMAGCGMLGGTADPLPTAVPVWRGHETQLSGAARLSCNSLCAARGQCGTLDTGEVVVLLGLAEPAVAGHTKFVANNTAVTITQNQERTLVVEADNTSYNLPFYQVILPDTQELAWVAGWCVEQ
jgi:hypothetical protein